MSLRVLITSQDAQARLWNGGEALTLRLGNIMPGACGWRYRRPKRSGMPRRRSGGGARPEPFGQPQLDERLAGHTEPTRLPINRLNHPLREIDVDALDVDAGSVGALQVEMFEDALASVEFLIKPLRFHNPSPLQRERAAPRSVGFARFGA
jgi:hypothetical protein